MTLLSTLKHHPNVRFVEPNYVILLDDMEIEPPPPPPPPPPEGEGEETLGAPGVPNDASFGQQYGLYNTGQFINGVAGIAGADIKAVEA